MADGRIYVLQPSFASGEISPDVASRVDLGKYQNALLQAENVFIRPYGSAYRRPGTMFLADIGSGEVRLQEFAAPMGSNGFLLMFQPASLKVYQGNVLKATLATPYTGSDLPKLRFAQSADTMFIASGTHPVQVLKRLTDTSWSITDFAENPGYFDTTTMTDGVTITPSNTTGTITLTASSGVFDAGQVGNWLQLDHDMDSITMSISNQTVTGGATTFSKDINYKYRLTVTGTWEGTVRVQNSIGSSWQTVHSTTANETYTSEAQGTGLLDREFRYEAEIDSGTANLTLDILDADDGDAVVSTVSASVSGQFGASGLLAGPDGWKLLTHGEWRGTVTLESSDDNIHWKALRKYTSDKDFNVSESGTFDEPTYLRINADISSGKLYADLTRLPYTHHGTVQLTGYTDATHMTGTVVDDLAAVTAAEEWAFGSWSATYGYPSCVTFFQDRLCFAANNRKPYMVWMSRTGDYFNFGTEKVDGTLTDDSAVAVSFITRRDFRILHLMAHSDLLVMTEGNEWIVNGSETVTPTSVTPRVQTSRGTTDVAPTMIGGQIIFVQRHGKTVRDMQYNFGSDSYDGMDLSILAKHITRDTTIIDCTYKQEPDYMMFFVLDDGTAACLTYVKEQNVYAWSRISTQGLITGVEAVETTEGADVYVTVVREDPDGVQTQFLEGLTWTAHSEFPDDYNMLDCMFRMENETPSAAIHIPQLANYTVDVLADGRAIKGIRLDENGDATLDVPASFVLVGLRYQSVFELCNIELQLNDGTLQGRRKKVAEVILRLDNSLGGRVGIVKEKTDVIKYDELLQQDVTLFSGEKIVTVPNTAVGGFNDKGRAVIVSDDPYPLSISSIVRAVVPGG